MGPGNPAEIFHHRGHRETQRKPSFVGTNTQTFSPQRTQRRASEKTLDLFVGLKPVTSHESRPCLCCHPEERSNEGSGFEFEPETDPSSPLVVRMTGSQTLARRFQIHDSRFTIYGSSESRVMRVPSTFPVDRLHLFTWFSLCPLWYKNHGGWRQASGD